MIRIFRKNDYFRDDFPFAVRHVVNRAEEFNLSRRFLREFWKITCVVSGSGRFVLGDQSWPIAPRSLLLVHPGAETTFDIDGDSLELFNLVFDSSLLTGFLKGLYDDFHFCAVFAPEFHQQDHAALYQFTATPRMDALIREITREYEERPSNWKSMIALQLQALLVHMLRAAERKIHHHPEQIIRFVRQRMQSDFTSDLSLGGLAENIGVTPAHLCRLYRKHCGASFSADLREMRLAAAGRMLRRSKRSVTEICFGCGFRDLSYFHRAFRGRFGVTPAVYRTGLD